MKIFVLLFVLLSIFCGLNNARCLKNDCKVHEYIEPGSPKIHYIYHGESCSCPRYHDVIIQEPKEGETENEEKIDIEYGIQKPMKIKEENPTRYLFDVRIEKPVEKSTESRLSTHAYQLQVAPQYSKQSETPIRYIFDTRIEEPVTPDEEKKWNGLYSKVDKISMHRTCGHKNCNCGCRDASHTPQTCNCNKDMFNLPIIYSDGGKIHKRSKRSETTKKSKKFDLKLPKLKKIDAKELASLLRAEGFKLKFDKKDLKMRPHETSRSKRRQGSPCGYTYESCDLKQKTPAGCPLCYRCHCEPTENAEKERFSPKDIRIPYKMASAGQQFSAPSQQEFDYEASAYTGLKNRDMYNKYIQEVISKYPEHMSRRMPDLKDQQQDLLRFIGEMSRRDKSPPTAEVANGDVRYKVLDNAVDLYKQYEGALSKMPRGLGNDGKLFKKKRGTVLEIIELNSDELENAAQKIKAEDFGENFSDN